MPTELIEETKRRCEESLDQADLRSVAEALGRLNVGVDDCNAMIESVSETQTSQEPVVRLKESLVRSGLGETDGAIERFMLINGALRSLPKLSALPVAAPIKEFLCEEYRNFIDPAAPSIADLQIGRSAFVAGCKLASRRRFPTGQLDWEISGLPKSYFARIPPRSLPRAAFFVAAKLKGFAPAFFIHLSANPKKRRTLTENATNKSYYLMAKSMELQPEIKGLVASSWLHSPDTHTVSPHLAWLNKTFLENNAFVSTMGDADADSGVFYRSPERKKLFDEGRFKPTTGLILWDRRDMLRWADAHAELGE